MSEAWQQIAGRIAHEHGLTLDELRAPGRARRVAWVRQKAWAALYDTGRYSYAQIARWFGKSDHGTVLLGVRAFHTRRTSTAKLADCGQQENAAPWRVQSARKPADTQSMAGSATHYSSTYYLPSWQGGDVCVPLCRRVGVGFLEYSRYEFRLTTERERVTCPACHSVLTHGKRPTGARRLRGAA